MRAAAMVAAMLALGACQGPLTTGPLAPTPPGAVRVMTYNVNYGIAGDPSTIQAIIDGTADLVFLQETNPGWEVALRGALGATYPHQAYQHCCLAGGLAVLSRWPVEDLDYVEQVGEGWFPAWRGRVATPLGAIQVLNVHLHPPLDNHGSVVRGYFASRPIRRREISELAELLEPGQPTLVVGDFNESAYGSALRYLEARGLRSAVPQFVDGATTWRWRTRLGMLHQQLDHVVYDAHLEPLDAVVLAGGRSDHRPVVVTFALAPQ